MSRSCISGSRDKHNRLFDLIADFASYHDLVSSELMGVTWEDEVKYVIKFTSGDTPNTSTPSEC